MINVETTTPGIGRGTTTTVRLWAKKKKKNHNDDDVIFSDEEDAFAAVQRLVELEDEMSNDRGAAEERARLRRLVDQWADSLPIEEDIDDDYYEEDDDDDDGDHDGGRVVLVERHGRDDRVAVFGGDPARRRRTVAKQLAPFAKLDQFGTPRDAGSADQTKLLRKIKAGKYDVVYVWTRFNCHPSRAKIRRACADTDTRFVEIESINHIQPPPP